MSKGVPTFQKDRLIQAREARGLTAVSLSELVGISKATLWKYENGDLKPTETVLQELSNKLSMPVNFFLKLLPVSDDTPIFYRSRMSATAHARKRSAKRFEWLKEIADYLNHYLDFPEPNLPQIDIPDDHRKLTCEFIEGAAQEVRKWWGIAPGPMPNIARLLEKNGMVLGTGKVDADNFDAFSQRRKFGGRSFVFLSTDKAIGVRSRFDSAHELAHQILHEKVDDKTLSIPAELKIIESQANYFASAFLMPKREFCEDLVAPSLDCFKGMKSRWKTSIAAMIMRCRSLEIIDEDQTKRLWINLNRRDWRTREPLDDVLEIEQPKLLNQSCRMIIDGGVATKQQILDDLCLPQRDVEELCSLPSGFFSEDFGQIVSFAKLRSTVQQPTNSSVQAEGSKIIPFSTSF